MKKSPNWALHLSTRSLGDEFTRSGAPVSEVAELQQGKKLLRVVENWLRAELEASRAREAADVAAKAARPGAPLPKSAGPLMPSKHMMFFRG